MKYYLIIPFLILLVGCLQPEKMRVYLVKVFAKLPLEKSGYWHYPINLIIK
jgi:hypothetical protein